MKLTFATDTVRNSLQRTVSKWCTTHMSTTRNVPGLCVNRPIKKSEQKMLNLRFAPFGVKLLSKLLISSVLGAAQLVTGWIIDFRHLILFCILFCSFCNVWKCMLLHNTSLMTSSLKGRPTVKSILYLCSMVRNNPDLTLIPA